MLIIAGHLIVDPADRDRYIADCAGAVAAARATDGCLDFALSPDALEPARVNVFERWQTRAALETFRGAGPDDETASRIRAAAVEEYEVAPA